MASDLQSLGALGPILPEIAMAIAALVLLLVGVIFLKRENSAVLNWVAIAVMVVIAGYIGFFRGGGDAVLFNGGFINDEFSRLLKVLVIGASAFSLLMTLPSAREHGIAKFEYAVLMLLANVGMMLMISANDLMSRSVTVSRSVRTRAASRSAPATPVSRASWLISGTVERTSSTSASLSSPAATLLLAVLAVLAVLAARAASSARAARRSSRATLNSAAAVSRSIRRRAVEPAGSRGSR